MISFEQIIHDTVVTYVDWLINSSGYKKRFDFGSSTLTVGIQ